MFQNTNRVILQYIILQYILPLSFDDTSILLTSAIVLTHSTQYNTKYNTVYSLLSN